MAKKYRVLNPRNLPAGAWIIRFGSERWYEGDEFTPPKGMGLERFLAQGFLKEVGDGKRKETDGDLSTVPAATGRSRRVAEPEASAVPGQEGGG
jgi:hypothetical protein